MLLIARVQSVIHLFDHTGNQNPPHLLSKRNKSSVNKNSLIIYSPSIHWWGMTPFCYTTPTVQLTSGIKSHFYFVIEYSVSLTFQKHMGCKMTILFYKSNTQTAAQKCVCDVRVQAFKWNNMVRHIWCAVRRAFILVLTNQFVSALARGFNSARVWYLYACLMSSRDWCVGSVCWLQSEHRWRSNKTSPSL